LGFESLCDHAGYLWGTATNYNCLFKIDKQTLKARVVVSLAEEGDSCLWKWRQYCGTIRFDDKLFFIPCAAGSFAVYDTTSSELMRFPVKEPENKVNYQPAMKFFRATIHGDGVYFFGHSWPGIVRIDAHTFEIEYFENCFPKNTGRNHVRSVITNGPVVTVLDKSSQEIIRIDLDTMKCETLKKLDFDGKRFCTELCRVGNYIYTPVVYDSRILKISVDNIDQSELLPVPESFVRGIQNYFSVEDGRYIWLMPALVNATTDIDTPLKIRIQTGEIERADEFAVMEGHTNKAWYWGVSKSGRLIRCFEMSTNQLVEYDCESGAKRATTITLDAAEEIASVIDKVSHGEKIHTILSENQDGTSGREIFKYCKQAVSGK
jgi:hypothetical protein